jgi:hypothetical protein
MFRVLYVRVKRRYAYKRPAALRWAFFCRRGRRDLFLGSSFPFFTDFVDGLAAAAAGEASFSTTLDVDACWSAVSFRFANARTSTQL